MVGWFFEFFALDILHHMEKCHVSGFCILLYFVLSFGWFCIIFGIFHPSVNIVDFAYLYIL